MTPRECRRSLERFPFLVRRAIQSLFGQRHEVVRARNESEQAQRRTIGLSKISFLEDYYISRAAAYAWLRIAWESERPFCLYLRSFAMGNQRGQSGDFEWLTTTEPTGGRLLRKLSQALLKRTPIFAISSPDEYLPHRYVSGPFANIVVDNRLWSSVVGALIPAAQLIVVHRAESSLGVNKELEAIRSAGRENATIIVRDPTMDNIVQSGIDSSSLQTLLPSLFREKSRRAHARQIAATDGGVFAIDPALEDFLTIEWRDDETLIRDLSESVSPLLEADVERMFKPFELFDPALAPAEEQEACLRIAEQTYEIAGQRLDVGDFRMAEELLFDCYASS